MNKNIKVISIFAILVLLIGGGYFLYKTYVKSNDGITINTYYDKNKVPIKGLKQAIIGGVGGVQYVTLDVNAKNTDTVPLDIKIVDATPSLFKSTLPVDIKTVQPGDTVTWTSGLVDISSFVNTQTTFSVVLRASSSLRKSLDKPQSLTLTIDEEPNAQFDVTINDPSGSSETNPGDTGTGTTGTNSDFETNAVPGSYSEYKSGTWIRLDTDNNNILEEYTYASTITAGACGGTPLSIQTPEGYSLNTYSGSSGFSIYICNPSGVGYKRYK